LFADITAYYASCSLELFVDKRWQHVATLEVSDTGDWSCVVVNAHYDDLYALDHFNAAGLRALFVQLPSDARAVFESHWPRHARHLAGWSWS